MNGIIGRPSFAKFLQAVTRGAVVPKQWYDTAYSASQAHRRQRDAWKGVVSYNATKVESLWHRLQEMQQCRDAAIQRGDDLEDMVNGLRDELAKTRSQLEAARQDCVKRERKLDRIQNVLDTGVCDDCDKD